MTSARGPNHYDVAILGGGLAGGCLARQLRQEAPAAARPRRRKAPASGARGGLQGRRIERRDRRPLFPEAARARAAPSRASSSKSSGSATSSRMPATATSPRASSSARPTSRRCRRSSSIAGGWRTCCFAPTPSSARRCSTAVASGSIALGEQRPASRVAVRARRARATITARWVVDASGRAGLLKRQLGPGRPSTHGANAAWWRVQLARPDRRLVGRRRLAGPRAVGAPLAEHEPPDGRRLLGLADSARVRQHQLRHRRRRRHASVPPHQPVRARRGLAARVRAAVRGGRRSARVRARGLSRPAAFRARLRARLLARSLGAGRRSGRVHRSVLLAGLRLHRDGQRLRHGPDRPRRARRGRSRRAPRRSTPRTCGCSTRSSGCTTASTRSWATRR